MPQIFTSENDLKKPEGLPVGDALIAFCLNTWFSSSKFESFSSKLRLNQAKKKQNYQAIWLENNQAKLYAVDWDSKYGMIRNLDSQKRTESQLFAISYTTRPHKKEKNPPKMDKIMYMEKRKHTCGRISVMFLQKVWIHC